MNAKLFQLADDTNIESTWWDLVNAIDEVTDTDDESFAVLETMLEEGHICFSSTNPPNKGWCISGPWS